ncbi:hypothetical protein B0H13DRAFT_1928447 [Mycena leptocephala]|nr:hypothetical protein B0H13DRAFT_1928447 [Mycena leptocephala]
MPSFRKLLLSAFLCLSTANAFQCGDNGRAELQWGAQAGSGGTVLGFSPSGPFDAEGNPILSVIALNAGFNVDFFAFNAYICGASPDEETSFGLPPSPCRIAPPSASPPPHSRAQTSPYRSSPACTHPFLPLGIHLHAPAPTQMFQWVTTEFVSYGWAFLGNQSTPVDATAATNYPPALVPEVPAVGAFVRLAFVPGGLAPSTGTEPGLVLELSDE